MIRLAFTGASGTGKSTLAEAMAAKLGLPICPVGSRSVSKEMGFESPYDVDDAGKRAEFQQLLFAKKIAWERNQATGFVTDRTHLDNLAYTFMHSASTAESMRDAVICAMSVYTHVVLCKMSAFHNTGDDAARVHDVDYHRDYEDYLIGLLNTLDADLLALDAPSSPKILTLRAPLRSARLVAVERFVRS